MNFVDAFIEWIGPTETPRAWLEWSALSLLAASCGNRIVLGYRRGHHEVRVAPNLYVMLVGPSGVGKSYALSRVVMLLEKVREIDHGTRLNAYSGHVTHSGMYEAMRTTRWVTDPKTKERHVVEMPWKGQFYLVQDELAQALGGREYADMVIRALVGMFNGAPFDDHTRTNGHVHLEGYVINWLAGTNVDWLLAAISPNTMNAGLFRRTVLVVADAPSERIAPNIRHTRPAGWDNLMPALVARIDELLDTEGVVGMTEEAAQIDAAWYMQLELPGRDDHGLSVPAGRHDLSLKLALLYCLAEGGDIVRAEHIERAQDTADQCVRWQNEIMPTLRKGVVGAPHDRILQQILSREGWIGHEKLARYAYDKCGIDARKLSEYIKTWLEAGMIVDKRSNGRVYYREVT